MTGANSLLYAPPRIQRVERSDGAVFLESAEELDTYPKAIPVMLRRWADRDGNYPLVAERDSQRRWRFCSYGEASLAADAIGQALLDRGLGEKRPLMILSGNSVGHLLVTLGALTVGVPVVPISVAYSTSTRGHNRIRVIKDLVGPGAVYVDDAATFAGALRAIGDDFVLLSELGGPERDSLASLRETVPTGDVEIACARLQCDTVAKILFTSGSTGQPKGVITTHGMLCANQQMVSQVWPFLHDERPVLVDWLPWSHTFGGNHNVNLVLANGGTLYIDDGRPTPELFQRSLDNYRDVLPTLSFNVPSAYAQLVPALEQDPELAERFFRRLRLMVNASAALPSVLRQRLEDLARSVTGRDIPVTGSWGTTETAPAATSAHYAYPDARCIGVPLPGVTLKLVPSGESIYELRVRGRNVTPGYYRRPDLTAEIFDDEGFFCSGDAVSFADPDNPDAGLLFRGRLAEDFKLSSGTFVHVGAVRSALLTTAPVLADAVITGEDRDWVGALAWLNPTETQRLLGSLPDTTGELVHTDALAEHLAHALAELNHGASSSTRIQRLLVMGHPASPDLGEITDKGYVNQRLVLDKRADLVRLLYSDPPPTQVITPKEAT